jgi:hypothetical protein
MSWRNARCARVQQNETLESVPWKKRLYDSYVSSGQAGALNESVEQTFRPRQAYIERLIRNLLVKSVKPK